MTPFLFVITKMYNQEHQTTILFCAIKRAGSNISVLQSSEVLPTMSRIVKYALYTYCFTFEVLLNINLEKILFQLQKHLIYFKFCHYSTCRNNCWTPLIRENFCKRFPLHFQLTTHVQKYNFTYFMFSGDWCFKNII